MSDTNDDGSNRTVVTTYVPEYQKEAWSDHAEELGMSQSEFVKTMVQAGRRGFGSDSDSADPGDPTSDADPQGSRAENGVADDLEDTVLQAIESEPYRSWEDLLEVVVGDIEEQLERAVTDLQQRNEITHSPRRGGYVRVEE
ncbi:MAG: DUF5805 domain-containing protein [Halanaeroarchaeum sp.]